MALKFDGQQLAKLRGDRSRAWLADQLDVGEVSVARWEAGTDRPNGVNALRLAQVLEVAPQELLKEEDAADGVPAETQAVTQTRAAS